MIFTGEAGVEDAVNHDAVEYDFIVVALHWPEEWKINCPRLGSM
jgi:hypothetical protein